MNAVPNEYRSVRSGAEAEPAAFEWVPDLLDFLSRHRRVWVGTTCIAGMLGLAAALVLPTRYTANALILVDARRADMLRHEQTLSDAQTLNALVESEVEVLRSDDIARKVVALTGWTGRHPAPAGAPAPHPSADADPVARAAERFERMLSVHRVGLTYVIEIDVTASTPDEAAKLANAVVHCYVGLQLQAQTDATRLASSWLQDRLGELRTRAIDADRDLQRYKAEHRIVDTDHGLMDQQLLTDLDAKIVSAGAHVAETAAKAERIDKILAEGPNSDGAISAALQDPVITSLRQRYFDDARQEAEWARRYGPHHAVAVRLQDEMAEIRSSIRNELQRLDQAARSDHDEAVSSLARDQAELEQLIHRSETTDASRVTARSLESAASTYRELSSSFLQRYTEAAQDQSFPVSETRIVSPATPPLHKSAPRRSLILSGSIVLGLGFGLALSAMLEILRPGLRRAGQLRRILPIDHIVGVPSAGRTDVPLSRAVIDHPDLDFARTVRGLQARLASRAGERRPFVLAITAARAGDGGTTIANNLALLFARAGRSVAIATDAPQDLAAGDLDRRDGITRVVLGSDRSGIQVADARRTIEELRRQFDVVVLDLPSLDTDHDIASFAAMSDELVLVATFGSLSERRLRERLEQHFAQVPRLAAAILNRDPTVRPA